MHCRPNFGFQLLGQPAETHSAAGVLLADFPIQDAFGSPLCPQAMAGQAQACSDDT